MKGDLDDSDSLKRAVKDVESVFLMGTPFEDGTEGETRRGKLMVDITKENNIVVVHLFVPTVQICFQITSKFSNRMHKSKLFIT